MRRELTGRQRLVLSRLSASQWRLPRDIASGTDVCLYPVLYQLVRRGLVERWLIDSHGPRRYGYRLSRDGMVAVARGYR